MLPRKRFIWRWKTEPILFIIVLTVLFTWIWIVTSSHFKTFYLSNSHDGIKENSVYQRHTKQDVARTLQYKDFTLNRISLQSEKAKGFEYDSQCIHLSKCFDYSKCKNGFFVYIHPLSSGEVVSPMYTNILNVFRASPYYTDDPNEACLSILSLDTHDRDVISANFVKHMNTKLKKMKHWNNGQNHLIVVFFSGTWPNYLETNSFNTGKAMVARASSSLEAIRRGFDLSIPLVPKDFPILPKNSHETKSIPIFPLHRKYLMSFKGKRYLYGIGSESRNALYLIQNKDFVLLTTCRHNKNWEKYKDDRCDADNEDYDRYNYNELLQNSTFCLIPRGRRLGSFRFLESMQHGCIPVLLSNGWDLPYKDLIDWSKFSLNIDERNLLQLPSIIEDISEQRILSMRQQTLFIYKTYFSSVTSIFNMMLEELRERIFIDLKRPYSIWNQAPGALNVDSSYSTSLSRLPFYNSPTKSVQKFTAIILAVSTVQRSSPLYRLIQTINSSEFVDQILVVWLSPSSVPARNKWPKTKVSLRVVHPPKRSMNSRYINMKLINTDAIFNFDEDVIVNTAEIDFAFSVWLSNPDRLVGFTASSHYLDSTNQSEAKWSYTTRQMNTYSMIDTSAAVFHRYYSHHYSTRLPSNLLEMVDQVGTCESLVMNFLISSLTQKSPIKVGTSSQFKPANSNKEHLGIGFTPESHFNILQKCFDVLVKTFGDQVPPLVSSKIAMNPVLFKDPVSITRKKFKRLEI